MEVVVPDGADLATKSDLDRLESALMARMLKLLLTVSLAQTGLTVTLVVALQR